MIQTVLGALDASQLGVTLMHEHCVWAWPGYDLDSKITVDWREARDQVVDTLQEARAEGVATIVDATVIGSGRKPEFLADVSERSGVNIICITGLLPKSQPRYFGVFSAEEIAESYISELAQGIHGTGVRAGLIKAASHGTGIDEIARRNIVAAAMASKATGTPIITHTDRGAGADAQLEMLVKEGIRPSRVVIGHLCCDADLAHHRKLMKAGAFVGFDRVGVEDEECQSDEVRAALLLAHARSGYAGQIMLSTDGVIYILSNRMPPMSGLFARRPSRVFREFIPRLKRLGVTDQELDQILVANPRRLFEGE